MNDISVLTRRDILPSGLAATVLPWLCANPLAAADVETPSRPARAKTFLFVDCFHVNKGDLHVTFDPQRITTEGKTLLETYARDFKKSFKLTGHGFNTTEVPFGSPIDLCDDCRCLAAGKHFETTF